MSLLLGYLLGLFFEISFIVDFSPTAIALGPSAIEKVSGQNCFRTFCGSLGRVRLGPPEGSTKVLQVSWCVWFSGAGPSWAAKRFHHGSPSFVVCLVLWGRSVLGCQKVPPKVLQVSWCVWFSGAGPSWAAKRFHQGSPSFVVCLVLWGRSVLGCQKVPPRFHQSSSSFDVSLVLWSRSVLGRQNALWKVRPRLRKFRRVPGSLGQIRLGLPKSSAEGSSKVSPRFHQNFLSFVVSLVLWARFVLGCQKVPRKVPPRFRQGSTKVSPRFQQGCPKVTQVSWSLRSSGADPFWGAKKFCGSFPLSLL